MWATLGVVVVIAVVGGWYLLTKDDKGSEGNGNRAATTNTSGNTNSNLVQVYTDSKEGFSVQYPQDWEVVHETEAFTGLKPRGQTFYFEGGIDYPINISIDNKTAEQYLATTAENRKTAVTVNGNTGFKVLDYGDHDYFYMYTLKNGHSVSIASAIAKVGSTDPELLKTFEAIARSIEIKDLSTPISDFQKYTDSVHGFSLQYPKDWQVVKQTEVVTGFGPNGESYSTEGTAIYPVSVIINTKTAADYLTQTAESRKTKVTINAKPGFKVLSYGDLDYYYIFDLTSDKSLVINSNIAGIVSDSKSQQYIDWQNIFTEMVESMVITNPAT